MCNKFCQRNPSNERERERGIEQYRGNVSKEQLPSNGSVLENKKKKNMEDVERGKHTIC